MAACLACVLRHSPIWGKDSYMEDRLEVSKTALVSLESNVFLAETAKQFLRSSSSEKNVELSVDVGGVLQPSIVLKFIGVVEIGDGSDSSGDWGGIIFLTPESGLLVLPAFSPIIWRNLGGTIECWFPKSTRDCRLIGIWFYQHNRGSDAATEKILMGSRDSAPDTCADSRTAGVFFRNGLPPSWELST